MGEDIQIDDPDPELNRIMKIIDDKTKNVTINSYDDINNLLGDDSIIRFAKS